MLSQISLAPVALKYAWTQVFFLEKRPLVPPRLAGYELCVAAESNDTPAAVSDERLEFVNSTNRKNHSIQGWGEVETNIEMEELETNFPVELVTKMMVVLGEMVVVGEWTKKEGRLSEEEGLLFQTS